MTRKPYEKTRLVPFLDRHVLALRGTKSQIEIAEEAGFNSPNMLAMIRSGANKLPIDRVPGLAKALGVDPARLLQLAIEQLGDDTTANTLNSILGTVVSRNEVAWLEAIREASDHSDPSLTSRGRAAIKGIFGK